MDQLQWAAGNRQLIGFSQGIGWALDMTRIACRVQQGARERRFSGPEVAMKMDSQARFQRFSQRSAQGHGAGFVVQEGLEVLHRIK